MARRLILSDSVFLDTAYAIRGDQRAFRREFRSLGGRKADVCKEIYHRPSRA